MSTKGCLVLFLFNRWLSACRTSLEHDGPGVGIEFADGNVAGTNVSRIELGNWMGTIHSIHCQCLNNVSIQSVDNLFLVSLHYSRLDCPISLYPPTAPSHFHTRKYIHCISLGGMLSMYHIDTVGSQVRLLSVSCAHARTIGGSRR